MRRFAAWAVGLVLLAATGCQPGYPLRGRPPKSTGAGAAPLTTGTPAHSRATNSPVAVKPAPPPKPQPPPKEMVIAWEVSLLYLLENGKPIGKPLILNSAEYQYLRPEHLGDFVVSEKMDEWRSNLFDTHGKPLPDRSMAETDGAVMRNWMRVGELSVGLHYSPAFHFETTPSERHRSHGCYRMSRKDSKRVWAWAPTGTPIHVVRFLAGTKWAFLLGVTPPELLPGYRPKHRQSATSGVGLPGRHRRHHRRRHVE